jgi:hypothetical protein
MSRFYTVTSMEVLPQFDAHSDVVIKLNFTYGDAEAFLSGSCSLPAPKDTLVPLESVSKELALEWLLANCLNTTEEFDAGLDAQIAEKANEPFVYDWAEPTPEEEPEA